MQRSTTSLDAQEYERLFRAGLADGQRWAAPPAEGSSADPAGPTHERWDGHPARPVQLDSLPGYADLREVHRGGQGVVYQALQRSTNRRVAIKVLRRSENESERKRFARESFLLSELRHPNIVTVYDAGEIADCHYIIMDFVDGVPIDDYVRARVEQPPSAASPSLPSLVRDSHLAPTPAGIPSRERSSQSKIQNPKSKIDSVLRLFAKVCDAVNAAHLKGVIHRDLKPANILVDATGEPRVLDFGLAKIERRSQSPVPSLQPDATAPTDSAGSSPADNRQLTTDNCTDNCTETGQFVGTVAWASPEQAAGRNADIDTRTDVYALGVVLYQLLTGTFPYEVRGPMRDTLNNIVTAEPLPPRRVLRRVVQSSALPVASAPRGGRRLWDRRPAGQVGDEVETIVLKCLAKDPARRYQSAGDLAGDIRRYLAGEAIEAKRESVAYALRKSLRRYRVPLAIAGGFALLITGGLITSIAFWQSARRERDRAVLAEQEQSRERERAVANERAATHEAERAQTVKALLDEMLELPARRSPTGEELSFQEHLAGFAESLSQRLDRQPEIEADVRLSVGKTYILLAFYTEAEEQFRRALEIRRGTNDELHPDVSSALQALADLMGTAGRHNEAVQLFQDGIERARQVSWGDHETIAWRLSRLSRAQREAGDLAAAESATREALGIRERLNGRNHPDVALSLAQLSLIVRTMGRHDDAIALARQAVEIDRATLGETDRTTTIHIEAQVVALRAAGHYQAAVDVWRDALRRAVEIHGEEHLAVAERMRQVAHFLFWIPDSAAEQATLFRTFLDLRRRLAPDDGAVLRRALWRTAEMHWLDGDLAAAEELLQEAVDRLPRDRIEDNHIDTHVMLAVVLRDRGALEQAEAAMRKALRLEPAEMPKRGRWSRGVMHYQLAAILRMRGDAQEAAKQASQAAEIFQTNGPWYHLGYAARFEAIGRHMLNVGDYESAADALGWAVRMRAAICPGHRTHCEAEDLLKVALAKLSVAPDGSDPDHPP